MRLRAGKWVTVLLLLLLSACSSLQNPVPTDSPIRTDDTAVMAPVHVCILFFNDLHGQLEPLSEKSGDDIVEVGGIARMGALVEKIREENIGQDTRTFLLVAGDILQGTPLSTVFKGQPDIEVLNLMQVDAMTVGNHEFDFGMDNFSSLREQAAFPFLSSNILENSRGTLLCDPFVRLPLSDQRDLLVIGVTTRELMTTTKPSNVIDLSITEPLDAIRQLRSTLNWSGPVILLSHSKAATDEAIAEEFSDLTAIIGGHDQVLMNPFKRINGVPVFQAFEKGKYLGRLDLDVFPDGSTEMTGWNYYPIVAGMPESSSVSAIVDKYVRQLDDRFQEVIGSTDIYLDGSRERIRYEETNLGSFVTDLMRRYTHSEIAVLNSGSLRAGIVPGPITVADVMTVMPYPNELVVVELTGEEIRAMLSRSVKGSRQDEDGGFLQVSGVQFRVISGTPESITVNGEPLVGEQHYSVAVTDFLLEGGDGYSMLQELPAYRTGSPLRELLVDAIRSIGTIRQLDGPPRIIREMESPEID